MTAQRVHVYTLAAILLAWFPSTQGLSQEHPHDTVFIKRSLGEGAFRVDTLFIPGSTVTQHVLVGTTFLPHSDNMIQLLNQGLYAISLEVLGECEQSDFMDERNAYPKFTRVERQSDTLTIDVSVIANCCHQFLGEAEIRSDTLNLLYTSYGGFCACECCFTLRYRFDTTLEERYQVLHHFQVNGSELTGPIPLIDPER